MLETEIRLRKTLATESTFSAVKRISGEYVTATKTENMIQEVILKFTFYNMLII
jgi:hypothetical protein